MWYDMTDTHDPSVPNSVQPDEGRVNSVIAPIANNEITAPKRRSKSGWRPGQSGNPKGRPPDGQSWSAIIREISEMSPEQIARMVGNDNDLGRAFLQMPRKVQMKYLIIARTIAALMFEPSKGMLDTLLERTDGKVQDKLDVSGALTVVFKDETDAASGDTPAEDAPDAG